MQCFLKLSQAGLGRHELCFGAIKPPVGALHCLPTPCTVVLRFASGPGDPPLTGSVLSILGPVRIPAETVFVPNTTVRPVNNDLGVITTGKLFRPRFSFTLGGVDRTHPLSPGLSHGPPVSTRYHMFRSSGHDGHSLARGHTNISAPPRCWLIEP